LSILFCYPFVLAASCLVSWTIIVVL
jgi:hypothetical protein